MAASVRITRITAGTSPATSTARGKSVVSAGTRVRLADVAAQVVSSAAYARLADVTAVAGTAAPATVRIGDVTAYAPSATYVWTGVAWIPAPPANSAISVARGLSSVTGTRKATVSGASVATGRSVVIGTVTVTGSLSLTGSGSLNPSGAQLGPTDQSGQITLSGGGALSLLGNGTQGAAGSGSVSVFAHPEASPPYVEIDLTGFLGASATLTRIDLAGNRSPVRNANPVALTGGTITIDDYEAPFGEPVRYECAATLTVTSDVVELDVTTPWLIHAGTPGLSQPLLLSGVPQRERDTNQAVHNVLGRRNSLVITDGVRRAAVYDLSLRTETADAALGLDALLDDAQPLLLQIAYAESSRSFYEWVAVGNVSSASMTDYFGDDLLAWTLSCTVTDAPTVTAQPDRTLANVAAEFATLADVMNNYVSMADIITDNLIGS